METLSKTAKVHHLGSTEGSRVKYQTQLGWAKAAYADEARTRKLKED